MKRIFIAFFSLTLIFAPALTFADDAIVICYEGETLEIPEEHLIEYDGATLDECDLPEELVGGNNDLATICHYPADAKSAGSTIEVDEDSLAAHLAHGDTLNACEAPVSETNEAPVIDAPWYASTTLGGSIEFFVSITDPDGDTLEITTELPDGATFNVASGTFSWTSSLTGREVVVFHANDGNVTSSWGTVLEVLGEGYIPGICGDINQDGSEDGRDIEAYTDYILMGGTPREGVDYDFNNDSFPDVLDLNLLIDYTYFGGTLACDINQKPPEEENAPPVIEGPAYASTTVGQVLEFEVTLSDPDGDDLILELNLPGGATYSESSSIFSWTPVEVGTTTAFWSVSDGEASATHTVALEVFESLVEDENLPPYFINFNPPLSATSGENYAYNVEAEDPENDTLSFSLTESPSGMTISELTGQINWTPEEGQVTSTPYNVTIEVTDLNSSTTTTYEIVVGTPIENPPGGGGETNEAPVIDAPWYASTTLGGSIEFFVSITDPDGDTLEITTELPDGATFNVASGTFSWTSSLTGREVVVFHANDGNVTSSWGTVLEVLGEGYIPGICGDINQDGSEDGRDIEAYTDYILMGGTPREGVDYDFNDDGFPDTLDLNLLIDNVYFGGSLSCSFEEPPIEEPPTNNPNPTVILSGGGGGGGGYGSGGGYINLPPEFVNFAPATSVVSYEFYSYNVEAIDPENGVLTFSLFDAPNGMSIIPETGIIYWYPLGSEEGGPHTVTVQVSDGINTVSETYGITVTPGAPPPPPIVGNDGGVTSPEEPEGSISITDTGGTIVPDNSESEEGLGLINATDEENFEKIGLLANIGAWFQDNLFIPILVIVIALILYLIYLAFVKKKKEDEPATIGDTQIGFSD